MFWGDAMRFEVGDGLSTLTQLSPNSWSAKSALERVLAGLKRRR